MPARPGSVMSPLHLSDKGFQSTRVYMFICIRTHIQYRVHIDRPVYSVDHHRPNVRMYDVPFHLSPSQFYPIVSVSRQTFNFYITKHSKITLDVYNNGSLRKSFVTASGDITSNINLDFLPNYQQLILSGFYFKIIKKNQVK